MEKVTGESRQPTRTVTDIIKEKDWFVGRNEMESDPIEWEVCRVELSATRRFPYTRFMKAGGIVKEQYAVIIITVVVPMA